MIEILKCWRDSTIFSKPRMSLLKTPGIAPELIISAHGIPGAACIDGSFRTAWQIRNLLFEAGIAAGSYPYMRLACCRSAQDERNSLAFGLSLLFPYAYVKGYVDTIDTCCQPDLICKHVNEIGANATSLDMQYILLSNCFVEKNELFHSITYKCGEIVAQKLQSPEGLLRLGDI